MDYSIQAQEAKAREFEAAHHQDEEPVRTCGACGQFVYASEGPHTYTCDVAPTVFTADGQEAIAGDRVFDFYNGAWVTIGRIDNDGWFDTTKDDGTRGAYLNGERVAVIVPSSNPFYAVWKDGQR